MLIWGSVITMAAEKSMKGHAGMDMSSHESMESHGDQMQFHHTAVDKKVRAEFQIMSLASMNMKDPQHNTHHIMVKLFHDSKNSQYKEAVGKVKIIGPDKSEQIGTLENYNGIFAANFTFQKKGKYGVMCLVKVGGEKYLYKFWYPFG
jgi:hypothetical protein